MVLPAFYALVIGFGMIAQWTLSYRTGQIPELQTEPIRIRFHIAGEMVTASALIVAGAGLLLQAAWAVPLYQVGMGMLFYTAIVSPGYFAQQGKWIWVGIFALIIILGQVCLWIILR